MKFPLEDNCTSTNIEAYVAMSLLMLLDESCRWIVGTMSLDSN